MLVMRGGMVKAGDVGAKMLESATSSLYKADLYVNTTTYGTETCVGTMVVYYSST